MSPCSFLVSVPGRALGEALSSAVGACQVSGGAWLQGNSWGWALGHDGPWPSEILFLEIILRKVSREVTMISGGLRSGSDFLQLSGGQ